MPTPEDLYEKWDIAFTAQEELEAEMYRILAEADSREEGEKAVMKDIVHRIDLARGEANKAWKAYDEAVKAAIAEDDKALAELEKGL